MKHTIQEKENIIAIALEAGFALSTAYGQEEPKLMPISDQATLQKFADLIIASQLQSILSEVEKLPSYNMEVSSFGHTESALNREQVLSIISNRMGEKI